MPIVALLSLLGTQRLHERQPLRFLGLKYPHAGILPGFPQRRAPIP